MTTEANSAPISAGTKSVVPRRYPVLLATLAVLFALRVLGQAVVAFFGIDFLPAMDRWYSGLVPYFLLLPIQIGLLVLMLKIVRDFFREDGFFVNLRVKTGLTLKRLSYLYALTMLARYAVTMALHPELRWFTGTLPIWFHFVLAAFLYTFGHYQTVRNPRPQEKR